MQESFEEIKAALLTEEEPAEADAQEEQPKKPSKLRERQS